LGPFEGFGEVVMVEAVDDGVDGCLGADDEDFDGLAVGFGNGIELKGRLGGGGLGGSGWHWEKTLNLRGHSVNHRVYVFHFSYPLGIRQLLGMLLSHMIL
jgi:hypothetical protein